jgi:ABC-type uncharacterized transport system fused permease/ATPase subunit
VATRLKFRLREWITRHLLAEWLEPMRIYQLSQRHIMGLFDRELKNTTVLSIGHRPDLAAYHARTLRLVHGHDGARLRIKPYVAPPPPRSWPLRLVDWWRLTQVNDDSR